MSPKAKGSAKPTGRDAKKGSSVEDFLRAMDHPMKKEIHAVRLAILDASPDIAEGIQWNGPSFLTKDYFATLNNPNNPRTRDHVALVLHTGAKAKGLTLQGAIADPQGLLKWLAKDRCLVTFTDADDVKAKREALQAILRQWIQRL